VISPKSHDGNGKVKGTERMMTEAKRAEV